MVSEKLIPYFFAKSAGYSVTLAKVYGIELSALIYILARKYWAAPFNAMTEDFASNALSLDMAKKAISKNIIIRLSANEWMINFGQIEKDLAASGFMRGEAASVSGKSPMFNNSEFKSLVELWNKDVFFKRYGRYASHYEIETKMAGKTVEECIQALKISIEQKYVQFFWGRKEGQETAEPIRHHQSNERGGFPGLGRNHGPRGDAVRKSRGETA